MLRWIALTGLALTPVAFAEEAPVGLEVHTDVRDSYVAGEPVLVRFTISNPTGDKASFADLANRPHLVRFDLVGPGGKKQTWFNTPPPEDTGQRWEIVSRGQRKVLLQIPSSQRLKPGRYTLTIRILDESGEVVLDPHSIELAPADPLSGTLVHDELGLERVGHQQAWVQRNRVGYDLYLHHADGANAGRTIADYHLLQLDGPVEPTLSLARPTERWDRHIYWQDGDKALTWVHLEGNEASAPPRTVTLPYPRIEALGRGATDAAGGLHMPVWIPGPGGGAGELRVVSVTSEPRFRLVTRLEAPPPWLATEIDSAGNLRMLLEVDGNLDLYTLAGASDLPAIGKRLVKNAPDDEGQRAGTPVMAEFGYLDDTEEGGGLAAFVLFSTEAGLVGRWVGLGGEPRGTMVPLVVPTGAELVDLLPISRDDYVLLVRSAEGVLTALSPGETPIAVATATDGGLLTNGDQVLVRTLEPGGPYVLHAVR
ncbi:MAG TPA: hypothetical protein QGF58_26970 [Myxococcota bacterium]|nr:hypothetical protein [Myxococcota bacterium]